MTIDDILPTILRLAPADRPVYLVGGAVRDRLLKRESHDLDFVMAGETASLARRVADALGGAFFILDGERDTSRVVLSRAGEGQFLLDFASLRGKDLESDLRGRDFTINAMATRLGDDHELIDPCGGVADLREKKIRACGPTSLLDDPVRTLRAVRLAVTLGYRIERDTLRQLRSAVAELPRISAERQRDELVRILEGSRTSVAMRLLEHAGALPVLLPEVVPLQGLIQPLPHHLDGWEHTLEMIDHVESLLGVLAEDYHEESASGLTLGTAVLWLGRYREQFKHHLAEPLPNDRSVLGLLKLCALYHDTGKAVTGAVGPDGKLHFLGHEEVSTRMIARRMQALAFSRQEIERAGRVVGGHMRVHALTDVPGQITQRSMYRFFRDLGDAGIDVCILSLADVWATYSFTLPQERWLAELQTCRALLEARWEKMNAIVRPQRLLSGDDLMRELGLPPGKLVGDLLELIREAQAAGEVTSTEEALSLAADWLHRMKGDH